MCLVFVEADYLVAVTYNMFYDFDEVLSFSKFFVRTLLNKIIKCHYTVNIKRNTSSFKEKNRVSFFDIYLLV